MKVLSTLLGVLACCFANTAMAAEVPVAGTATTVVGQVSAVTAAGIARPLSKDYSVYSGERISTGSAGYVRLNFRDGSSTVLRPNSEFEIVSFRFQPNLADAAPQPAATKPKAPVIAQPLPALQVKTQAAAGNQAFFKLIRGGFRAVSGLVGKINREEYAVRTPVATIGIRGTTFLSIVCDAVCAADPTMQDLLPEGEGTLGGTVSGVDEGSIVVTSSTGEVVTLNAPQFVFTTAAGHHIPLRARPGFLKEEQWLESSDATGASESSEKLLNTSLTTSPIITVVSSVVLFSAAVLISEAEDGGSGAATSTTPTTSTSTSTSTSTVNAR